MKVELIESDVAIVIMCMLNKLEQQEREALKKKMFSRNQLYTIGERMGYSFPFKNLANGSQQFVEFVCPYQIPVARSGSMHDGQLNRNITYSTQSARMMATPNFVQQTSKVPQHHSNSFALLQRTHSQPSFKVNSRNVSSSSKTHTHHQEKLTPITTNVRNNNRLYAINQQSRTEEEDEDELELRSLPFNCNYYYPKNTTDHYQQQQQQQQINKNQQQQIQKNQHQQQYSQPVAPVVRPNKLFGPLRKISVGFNQTQPASLTHGANGLSSLSSQKYNARYSSFYSMNNTEPDVADTNNKNNGNSFLRRSESFHQVDGTPFSSLNNIRSTSINENTLNDNLKDLSNITLLTASPPVSLESQSTTLSQSTNRARHVVQNSNSKCISHDAQQAYFQSNRSKSFHIVESNKTQLRKRAIQLVGSAPFKAPIITSSTTKQAQQQQQLCDNSRKNYLSSGFKQKSTKDNEQIGMGELDGGFAMLGPTINLISSMDISQTTPVIGNSSHRMRLQRFSKFRGKSLAEEIHEASKNQPN